MQQYPAELAVNSSLPRKEGTSDRRSRPCRYSSIVATSLAMRDGFDRRLGIRGTGTGQKFVTLITAFTKSLTVTWCRGQDSHSVTTQVNQLTCFTSVTQVTERRPESNALTYYKKF